MTTAVQRSQNANAGFDYKIDSLTSLGGSVLLNDTHSNLYTTNHGSYLIGTDSLYRLAADIGGINHWQSLNYDLFLNKVLQHAQKVNFDLNYIHYKNELPTVVNSSFVNSEGQPVQSNDTLFSPQQKGISNSVIRQLAAQADYTKQFSNRLRLSAGVKETCTRTFSFSAIESLLQGRYVSRSASVNNTSFSESISAAYASLETKPDSLTSVQAGLRYEYAYQTVTGRNGGAFPSLLISRRLLGQAEVYFSYTKRISRPSSSDCLNGLKLCSNNFLKLLLAKL